MTETRHPDQAAITEAASLIRDGRLVAFGTETVYGLGGNALDGQAVARIFAAKSRPGFNPLISHVADSKTVFETGKETPLARILADHFWPGPMTLVLDQQPDCPISTLATSGLDSVALRVPANTHARAFLAEAGVPVAAPSANRSGRISPTRAGHVLEELGGNADLAMILDCGAAEGGLESTVIDARGAVPVILRPGSITDTMIEDATGIIPGNPSVKDSHGIISPGQMESHYAPATPLMLNQNDAGEDTVWIGFGDADAPLCRHAFNLSPRGDLIEAAASLYDLLRQADRIGAVAIAVAPVPHGGIGTAINDRLNRAAKK